MWFRRGSGSQTDTNTPPSPATPEADPPPEPERPPAQPDELHTSTSSAPRDVDRATLAREYKKGAFDRILAKTAFSGALGLLLSPVFATGALPLVAAAGSANAAAFTAFYDSAREAATSAALVDTPLISAGAGALAGYVWNGLVHQSRAKALAGSAAVAAAATLLHAALPTFEADKALLGTLLDLDLLEDPRGAIRARVDAPPVLPPFSLAGTRAALGALALRVLPVREVSDAEFEAMRELNPPMVLPPRRLSTPQENDERR